MRHGLKIFITTRQQPCTAIAVSLKHTNHCLQSYNSYIIILDDISVNISSYDSRDNVADIYS